MKRKLVQVIAGAIGAFIATMIIYLILQREGGAFSGIIVAIFTGLGIAFGQKTSTH